ncbi:hypothetical protein ACFO8O_12570 [Hephaestia sp. GCM10023244]|uniref:hypothetical protein n=1 Tax=unclassified Hephaestia TaxID=2631281 RepID=UPI0020774FC8|nr:hypothetical protein [Hephaestia sp. MAHUQ-44]MCM8731795.1 hypothetical protein [Hephaestia sp. MAHUQ-44]
MATVLSASAPRTREPRFFFVSACVMAATIVAGFSLHWLMGRSTFRAPLHVHVHAVAFMGWTALYVFQTHLITSGARAQHRRLGWIAAIWASLLAPIGIYTTIIMVRAGHTPFFFTPAYFLALNPIGVLTFTGLFWAGVAMRRRTEWHRRLIYCAMTMLLAPAFGRLLPAPLMMPWVGLGICGALLLFPLAGVIADWRTRGRVHPGWWVGIGTIVAAQLLIEIIGRSALGLAFAQAVTAGSVGGALPLDAYPPFPLS